MVFGGFSLLTLFVQTVQDSKKKKNHEEEHDEVLDFISSHEGFRMLESYCENEFSTENIYLMDLLLSRREGFGNNDLMEQTKLMNTIHERFIKTNSICEVNISSSTRQQFIQAMKLANSNNLEMSSNVSSQIVECLASLKMEIIVNLADTYSRFINSRVYAEYQMLIFLSTTTQIVQ